MTTKKQEILERFDKEFPSSDGMFIGGGLINLPKKIRRFLSQALDEICEEKGSKKGNMKDQWEKEFDERFLAFTDPDIVDGFARDKIIDFIRSLLKTERQRIEEMLEKVLNILDKAETERVFDMPDTTDNWKAWKGIRNSITNLLNKKL